MKKLLFISIIFLALFLSACTEAERASIGGLGNRHKLELYSGGAKIGEWTSPGKIYSESGSDGKIIFYKYRTTPQSLS